jgi:hypothetical protein
MDVVQVRLLFLQQDGDCRLPKLLTIEGQNGKVKAVDFGLTVVEFELFVDLLSIVKYKLDTSPSSLGADYLMENSDENLSDMYNSLASPTVASINRRTD